MTMEEMTRLTTLYLDDRRQLLDFVRTLGITSADVGTKNRCSDMVTYILNKTDAVEKKG